MRDDLAPYCQPNGVTYPDARDWLRQELSAWPYVTSQMRVFLDALDWRARGVVILTFGEQLRQDQVAYRLGLSIRTVASSITQVCILISSKPIT
jgi:DNA-directed RNA polymerase specialized sigma24 family protein